MVLLDHPTTRLIRSAFTSRPFVNHRRAGYLQLCTVVRTLSARKVSSPHPVEGETL